MTIAPVYVFFLPNLLLMGAAAITPMMLAACPNARYSPLNTKGTPKIEISD